MELVYVRLVIGVSVVAMLIAGLCIDKIVNHYANKRKVKHERALAALKPEQRTYINGYGRYI